MFLELVCVKIVGFFGCVMIPMRKGEKHTLETRQKMSAAKKGRGNGRLGTHQTEATENTPKVDRTAEISVGYTYSRSTGRNFQGKDGDKAHR